MAESFVKKVTVDYDPKGLEEAIRHEEKFARQTDQTTEATGKATKATQSSTESLQSYEKASLVAQSAMKGMVFSIVGVGGLMKAWQAYTADIQANSEAMKENAKVSQQLAEQRLDLAALRGVESPEDIKKLDALASFSGRSQGEVARANTVVTSRFGDLSKEAQNQLMMEIAAMGRTTSTSLVDLADPFSTLIREGMSPREASNVLQQAIIDAGEPDPSRLGQQIGRIAGVAKEAGGLSPAQAAGLAAGSTQLNLMNETAATGFRNIILAIRGKGTPQGNAVMSRLKLDRSDVLGSLQAMGEAAQRGDINAADMEAIAGRENIAVLAALGNAGKRGKVFDAIANAEAASAKPESLVLGRQQEIFGSSPMLAFNQAKKILDAQIESTKANDGLSANRALGRKRMELFTRKLVASGDITEARANAMLSSYDYWIGTGENVAVAMNLAKDARTNWENMTTLGGVIYGPGEGDSEYKNQLEKKYFGIGYGADGIIKESEERVRMEITNVTNQYNGGTSAEQGDSGRRAQP